MADISEALLKRSSILLIILGAIMVVIAVAGNISVSTFALSITSLIGQIIVGVIGFALIGLGTYLELMQTSFTSRKDVEKKVGDATSFFIGDFPKQLETDFESAQEVWVFGRTVRQFIQYATIEQKLQKGHIVKVLIIHPDSVALSMAESFVHGRVDVDERRLNATSILKDLCQLKTIYPKKLEIRTTDILVSHRVVAINPLSDSGALYMHYYPYKPETNRVPKYILTSKNGYWYNFFKQELLSIWESGKEWDCHQQ